MSDLYSRALTSKDMPFIMNEFEAGAKAGNYSKEFFDPKLSKRMERQIREMIQVGESGQYTGHYFYILTRHSDEQAIGYIWLIVAVTPDGIPCLEIRAIGITKQFRGRGYASMMLSDWIDSNSHEPFQAKCFSKSTQMIEMLKRRGFITYNVSLTGNKLLVRYPQ